MLGVSGRREGGSRADVTSLSTATRERGATRNSAVSSPEGSSPRETVVRVDFVHLTRVAPTITPDGAKLPTRAIHSFSSGSPTAIFRLIFYRLRLTHCRPYNGDNGKKAKRGGRNALPNVPPANKGLIGRIAIDRARDPRPRRNEIFPSESGRRSIHGARPPTRRRNAGGGTRRIEERI